MKELIFSQKISLGHFEVYNSHPDIELFRCKQTHSKEVTLITPIANKTTLSKTVCDGISLKFSDWEVNQLPNLSILTADCMPIALTGKSGLSFIHAGWKGLSLGICNHPIHQSLDIHHAYIGPSAGPCCYEVQEEFQEFFPQSKNFIFRDKKIYFDLKLEAAQQIKIHFKNIKVEFSPICTICTPKFHSFRRDKTPQRNWNVWRLV